MADDSFATQSGNDNDAIRVNPDIQVTPVEPPVYSTVHSQSGGDVKISIPLSVTNSTDSARKSYQARALFRKTLSYQKRQTGVNICCVFICPLLMIAIAGILSLVFSSLLASRSGDPIVQTIRYCSGTANMNITTGNIALLLRNDSQLRDKSLAGQLLHANYYQLAFNRSAWPCVQVFQNAYKFSSPYMPDPGVNFTRDTTFMADPTGGWWSAAMTSDIRSPLASNQFPNLNSAQQFPWNYLHVADGVSVGQKSQGQTVDDPANFPTPGSEGNKSGFLGRTPTNYLRFSGFGQNASYIPADFYVPVDSGVDPDDFLISRLLNITVTYEAAFSPITGQDGKPQLPVPGNPSQLSLLTQGNLTTRFPFYGLVYINSYDSTTNKISVTLQTGFSKRLNTSVAFSAFINPNYATVLPPKGFRLMQQISQLSNALLALSPVVAAQNNRIAQVIRAFPQDQLWNLAKLPVDIGVELGKTTFPFGLSFLLPVFVLTLVREKEDRILIMMKMNGLSTFTYYLAHYLHFFVLQAVCSLVFVVSGVIFRLKFFAETDPGVYIIALLVWANTMIALAFVLSLIFNKSRFALIMTFALVVVSCILSASEDILFNYAIPPNGWYIWPLFAFFHALRAIGNATASDTRSPYQVANLVAGDEVAVSLAYLFIEGLILFVLMFYLKSVLRTEYGVSKPWYFIFTEPLQYLRKLFTGNLNRVNSTDLRLQQSTYFPEDNLEMLEDSDVKEERSKVTSMTLDAEKFQKYPLIISNIRKVYGNGKIANKAMCLLAERNVVFGLLGPNGAGKSTLIQMMTGLYPPSSGTAFVAGYDINTQMDSVYLNIGVCPQHDILWDDLTCEEHLLFYGRLRGIPKEREQEAVERSLAGVNLQMYRDRLTKRLSGGEKRRLSIAIALMGDVPLIFMDEPTTGLDPEVRRTIWNIIQKAKQGKTIILTTHSMEEADFLSSRIGIMSKGVLRCLGTPLHLKRKYGRGYKLTVSFYKDTDRDVINRGRQTPMLEVVQASTELEKLLPKGSWAKSDQGGVQGSVTYEFEDQARGGEKGVISHLLDEIEAGKAYLGIEDWGISQTSLEEVFLNIVKDEDVQATTS